MGYYDRNGKKLNLDIKSMKYLDHGSCANVLHNDEIIFKFYYSETGKDARLHPIMFDILKQIDSPSFIKIFEIYCDINLLELLQYKFKRLPFSVDAYTAKYYPDDTINVLDEDINYILDSFKELERLSQIFADNKISMNDIKRENSILSPNGIILIDPDCFFFLKEPLEPIEIGNKRKLLYLLKNIILICVHEKRLKDDMFRKKIDSSIMNIKIDENTNITDEIYKVFKHVKKPIDYFIK